MKRNPCAPNVPNVSNGRVIPITNKTQRDNT